MSFVPPGHMRSVEEFRARWLLAGASMDCALKLRGREGPLGQPIEVIGRTLTNRFAVHPMEGWDAEPNGLPSELTLRRWRRFGRSGAALLWGGEAFAVQEDGRANPRQLFLNPRQPPEPGLARLLAEVRLGREESGVSTEPFLAGLQLTHSGRYSEPTSGKKRPKIPQHHPILDRRSGIDARYPLLTDLELEGIGSSFIRAAKAAEEAGFDFVDIKCCHGYLLHELLSARARPGHYGGSFENRTRFLRRLIREVQNECPGLGIGVRLSVCDSLPFARDPLTRRGAPESWDSSFPYRFGFGVDENSPLEPNFDEPLRLLERLSDDGVRLINVTVGSPYACAHLQRPAAYPPSDGYLSPVDPLAAVAYQINAVRRCKAALPDLVLVGSGYSYLQEFLPHVAEHEVGSRHADLIGLGRMILSYPEFPLHVLAGRGLERNRLCRTFSDCTTGPRNGMVSGCYPLDPLYRSRPEAQRVRALRKAGIRSHSS